MSNINLFPELDNEQNQEQEYNHASKQTSEDELIVFGYSCKLFRDDFSAKAIDRGQSLIPWNGDENVMIDRYDCRGHLFDLTIWDSDLIKLKSNEYVNNDEDKRIEDECNQERYCDLYRDMEKETLRQEEEFKRLNTDKNSYNQVGFTYEQLENSKESSKTSQTLDDDDDEYEPFYPSEKLQIPYGMDIPESIKLNSVIEKTACFVSTSGLQMEIVLKTKQANNPQFDFLKYDHYLNPYYRHLIIMIKSGKYRPHVDNHSNNNNNNNQNKQSNKNGIDQNSSHDEDEGNDSYLHPLLRGKTTHDQINTMKTSEKVLRIPSVPMNIHNTAYGQLIKKYEHLRQSAKVVKENDEEKMSPKNDEASPRSECSSSSGIVIPPPPDVKPIIDKLAEYVARNGQEFERSIRTKNDERFGFLERDHIHHNYYQLKLQLCLQENQSNKVDDDDDEEESHLHQTPSDENIKLVLKSTKDKCLASKSSQEFHSDNDSPSSKEPDDENGEFIGPRPPSPDFLEKMRKQEQRRDRLNEFVREKLVRNKQEERKRKAELLIQKLKTESISSTVNSIESTNINSNLIEKLLNVKDECSSSSRLTSQLRRTSKRSRSKSTSRSKYYRRSRSKSSHRRPRRSSHKRSRTRSKSRSHHRSKRSKNSKSSRNHRRHRHRRSSPSSSSSRSSSSAASHSSSSTSSSSSHEKKKKKQLTTTDENQRKKNPQSSKWDQREPIKTKSDDKDLSLSMSTESTISNSMTS